ncbi:hypothetical protein CANINC_004420 [Pichia inconspicua]|uniref:Peptidase A1 domain-containing protein n=1 Tax=Pichia inconspicua TaxID=52247 RepID=A0A4T0WWF7_9ASCO|nr:hypothetical protein CANINC_004420 [[Candida] inconspicua]
MPFSLAENYVKLDARKLRGSWSQNSNIDKYPIYVYYKNHLNESTPVNDTVAGVYNDKVYYAVDLAIGSNAQNVTVLVDTLSSDLWINSVDNEVCINGLEEDDGPSNFTIQYIYSNTASSSSSPSSSKAITHTPASISKHTTTYFNSESDAYIVEVHESTETFTTTTATSTYKSTESFDIQFYPSQTASTNWLSAYPHPTYALDNLEILEAEPQNCSGWGLFDYERSDSFITKNETFIAYSAEDSVHSGIWAKDFVLYGNSLLSNVSFGLVNKSNIDSFGVLGVGLENAESTWLQNKSFYENFPQQLKSQGFIKKVVYSLYENYLLEGSSLLFGGIDREQFVGNLSVVPLIELPIAYNDTRNASAVAITLSSISFTNNNNDTSLIASGLAAAIIDTTSATGAVPYYVYNEIIANAGFLYSSSLNAYIVNGTEIENSTVGFKLQDVQFDVPLLDLTFPLVEASTNNESDFVVFGIDATYDHFVLGDAILQYIYVAVDLEDKELAIAPKNFFPLSEDIVAVESSFPNATTASSYNFTYGYNDITELKLATVHNPNSISKTSFSISYIPSATLYEKTLYPSESSYTSS